MCVFLKGIYYVVNFFSEVLRASFVFVFFCLFFFISLSYVLSMQIEACVNIHSSQQESHPRVKSITATRSYYSNDSPHSGLMTIGCWMFNSLIAYLSLGDQRLPFLLLLFIFTTKRYITVQFLLLYWVLMEVYDFIFWPYIDYEGCLLIFKHITFIVIY